MFNVETYMQDITEALKRNFVDRLIYVGLQGSYLRGEATENSDIDVVVIIDKLSAKDLLLYKKSYQKWMEWKDLAVLFAVKRSLKNGIR